MEMFETAHKFTAKWEGGVCEDPADPGGLTMYGVATHFLTDFIQKKAGREVCAGYGIKAPITRGQMLKITPEIAARILKAAFWPGCDLLPLPCAIAAYDARVNCGDLTGVKLLQRGIISATGSPLAIDGIIGPITAAAARKAPDKCAQEAIAFRESRYASIVAAKPNLKKFHKGWLNRLNDLRRYLKTVTN